MAILFGKIYGKSPQVDSLLNSFFIFLTLFQAGRILFDISLSLFTPLYIFLGSLIADFISGSVHMLLDNLRLAEEHHEKPHLITEKPYYVQNGESLLFTIFLYSFFPHYQAWLWACLWGIVVEINHAYQHETKVPWFISLLWKGRILLSREEHRVHHYAALQGIGKNYCLLNGFSERAVLYLESSFLSIIF